MPSGRGRGGRGRGRSSRNNDRPRERNLEEQLNESGGSYSADDDHDGTEDPPPDAKEREKEMRNWTLDQLRIIGETMIFVKSHQKARTYESRSMNKWDECVKALANQGFHRTKRAIQDKWHSLEKLFREMHKKTKTSGRGRRGINFKFLAKFGDFFIQRTEKHFPSYKSQTKSLAQSTERYVEIGAEPIAKKSPSVFVAPLRKNVSETNDAPVETETNDAPEETEQWPKMKEKEGDFERNMNVDDSFEDEPGATVEPNTGDSDGGDENEEEDTSTRPTVRTIVIDEEEPNEFGEITETTFMDSPETPELEIKRRGIKSRLKKGNVVEMERHKLDRRDRSFGPKRNERDPIPVVIRTIKKGNFVDIVTIDGQILLNVARSRIDGLVMNPEVLTTCDAFNEPLEVGEKVFLREGFEERKEELKGKRQRASRLTPYFLICGFGVSCILGRKTPNEKSWAAVIGRKNWQLVAARNRPESPEIPNAVPRIIHSPFGLRNIQNPVEPEEKRRRMEQKLGELGVNNDDACVLSDTLYFCIRDSVLEGYGPCLMDTDGNAQLLNDFKNLTEMEVFKPGDETATGRDGEEIATGQLIRYFKPGNVQDLGTVRNVAGGYSLIQRQTTGAAVKFDVAHESNCCQIDSRLEQSLRDWRKAAELANDKIREPVLVRARPKDGPIARERNMNLDGNDDDNRAQGNQTKRKSSATDREDGGEPKAKAFARELVNELMPGLQDLAANSWRDKTSHSIKLHSQTQMAATLHIQTALYSMNESRRAEILRLQRQQLELSHMARVRHLAFMQILNRIKRSSDNGNGAGSRATNRSTTEADNGDSASERNMFSGNEERERAEQTKQDTPERDFLQEFDTLDQTMDESDHRENEEIENGEPKKNGEKKGKEEKEKERTLLEEMHEDC